MTPEQYQQIKEVLQNALELPANQRAAYLDKACAGDAAMRAEVETLLASHEQAPSFFEKPAGEMVAPFGLDESNGDWEGKRLGPYRLQRSIGQGGMGLVYLAVRDDGQYEKQVAIKLIKHGMDTDEILQRFRHERQTLATLDHPNIARLLDGNITEDGLPYFVMEYIDGEPIDVYCDNHKLNTSQRLQLFRTVCAAVQYAHQNLIVHRDLKPSNIIITKDSVPKLLDFGIAKLLHPNQHAPERTMAGQRLMTPEYASPEQVRGEAITTASDVYSLGVLLYKLLTGHRPYRFSNLSPTEIERVICATAPEKPSTVIRRAEPEAGKDGAPLSPGIVSATRDGSLEKLQSRLRGDIDNIVLKALAKEPQRRYNSVEQFSEDIRRHLEGLPVVAHGDTFGYRSVKFIKRHKAGVIAAGLVVLSLVAGLVGTMWQARAAARQRDLAVRAANTMIYELAEGLKQMSGPTESRLGLLTQAAKIFDDISNQSFSTPDLQRRWADANKVLVQTYRILGDMPAAQQRGVAAERRARELASRPGAELQDRTFLGAVLIDLGDNYVAMGQDSAAKAAYDESQLIYEKAVQESEATLEMKANLGLLLVRKGDRLYYEGKLGEVETLYNRTVQINQAIAQQDSNNTGYQSIFALSLERLGDLLYATGKVDSSCRQYRTALEVRRRMAAGSPDDVTIQQGLAIAMQNVAWCERQEAKWDAAIARFNEAIQIQRRLLKNDPSNTMYLSNLIGGLGEVGSTYLLKKDSRGAIPWYREALELGKGLRDKSKTVSPDKEAMLANLGHMLADALLRENQLDEGEKYIALSIDVLTGLIAKHPETLDYSRSLAYAITSQGDLLRVRNKLPESLQVYEKALAMRQRLTAASGASDDKQLEAYGYFKLGQLFKIMAQPARARQALLTGKQILLDLRAAQKLADESDGHRFYLPEIENALAELPKAENP